jgi:hypothetical protein
MLPVAGAFVITTCTVTLLPSFPSRFTSTKLMLGTGMGVAVGVAVLVGGTGVLVGALIGVRTIVAVAVRVGVAVAARVAVGCGVFVTTGEIWPPGLRIAVAIGLEATGCRDGVGLDDWTSAIGTLVAVAVGGGVAEGSGLAVSVGLGLVVGEGEGSGLAVAVGSWLGVAITTRGWLSPGPTLVAGWFVNSSGGAAAAGCGAGSPGLLQKP